MDQDYVYFIEHPDGYYKIGKSIDPEERLSAVQRMCPYELELAATIQAVDDADSHATTLECHLHDYYSRARVRGEWFDIPEKEIVAIDHLSELRASDVRRVKYDICESYTENGSTLFDYLQDVWVMRRSMEGDS